MFDRYRFVTTLGAALLGLVACRPADPGSATQPQDNAAVGNTLAALDRLNPAQVQMVLFRAVRDADQECQDVTDAKHVGMLDGQSAWLATCRGRLHYLVTIANDGTASVTDARRVRGIGQPGGPPAP